jgi:hypothetical protein
VRVDEGLTSAARSLSMVDYSFVREIKYRKKFVGREVYK